MRHVFILNPVAGKKKSIKKLFSASVSVCVFAIFDAMSSRFSSNHYEGPFFTVYTTVPTMYGVAGKTYVSTWSCITGVGIGFSYPSSFDYGVSKTKYTLCKKINLSASIRNFVNKKTKGLKT